MGSTNTGNQTIRLKYGQSDSMSQFSNWLAKVIKPGIYEGGEVTIIDFLSASIAPFKAIVRTSTNELISVETSEAVIIENDLDSKSFLSMNFIWVDTSSNYADFTAKAYSEIYSNDIVFGEYKYTYIDYEHRTIGYMHGESGLYSDANENETVLKLQTSNSTFNKKSSFEIKQIKFSTTIDETADILSLTLDRDSAYSIKSSIVGKVTSGQIESVYDSTSGMVNVYFQETLDLVERNENTTVNILHTEILSPKDRTYPNITLTSTADSVNGQVSYKLTGTTSGSLEYDAMFEIQRLKMS